MKELKSNSPLLLLSTALCTTLTATAADLGNLRVGAAKIDITPSTVTGLKNPWGTTFQGVHDHVYVRAIVLDNGQTGAALISIDTSSIPDTSALRRRIEEATGIPAGHVMISTTHTHNAPAVGAAKNSRQGGSDAEAYTAAVENSLLEAVRQSKARLQPGRLGVAAGGRISTSTGMNSWATAGRQAAIQAARPIRRFGFCGSITLPASLLRFS